jgi:hypothetical protein
VFKEKLEQRETKAYKVSKEKKETKEFKELLVHQHNNGITVQLTQLKAI